MGDDHRYGKRSRRSGEARTQACIRREVDGDRVVAAPKAGAPQVPVVVLRRAA